MATIRCKACGKLYSYEKEGCCPGCGAYNRPPKREQVNPDGTIQHMTDAEYSRRSKAAGKVCFEEKECYEEKVCYEDQARRGNRKNEGHTDRKETPHSHAAARENPAAEVLRQMMARSGSRRKSKGRSVLGALIAIIIAIGASTGVLGAVFDRIEGNIPWHEEPMGQEVGVAPADEYFYDAVMGEQVIAEDGSTFTVESWTWDDKERTVAVSMDASFADSDHGFYVNLLCTDRDGDEITLDYKESRDVGGRRLLLFDTVDYKEIKPFCLILEECDGENDELNTWWIDLR